MTQRSRAGYKTFKNSEFATNGTGAITATKVRDVHEDLADSVVFIDDAGERYSIKVSVSSAELLAIFTTPKQLIAAPGASKFIQITSIIVYYNYATAAYATNTTLQFPYAATALGAAASLSGIISQASSRVAIHTTNVTNTGDLSSIVNQPVNLTVSVGNPTAGGGTVDVYITYTIMDQ